MIPQQRALTYRLMRSSPARRFAPEPSLASRLVTGWDEFGQGYGESGLIVCICGMVRPDGDWSDHYCPFDEPMGEAS